MTNNSMLHFNMIDWLKTKIDDANRKGQWFIDFKTDKLDVSFYYAEETDSYYFLDREIGEPKDIEDMDFLQTINVVKILAEHLLSESL